MFVSIGEAAKVLGVVISTLRRWELETKFVSDFRTCGGHRRYSLTRLPAFCLKVLPTSSSNSISKKTYAYARVSSHDQKLDLKRQEQRLTTYCYNQTGNLN